MDGERTPWECVNAILTPVRRASHHCSAHCPLSRVYDVRFC
jgi:hypothetical protein